MKRAGILFFMAIFATAPSGRAANISIQCDSPDDLSPKIQYCTQNTKAVQSAADCVDRVKSAIRDASDELSGVFGKDFLGSNGVQMQRQKRTFGTSATDYQRAVQKLDFIIAESTRNLHYLADYPGAMLDDPNGHVPCYSENFAKLQKLVSDLDNKVTELKNARAANAKLGGIVEEASQRIENNGGHGPENADFLMGGQARNRDSGVSGTSKKEGLGGQGRPAKPEAKSPLAGISAKSQNDLAGHEPSAKESGVSAKARAAPSVFAASDSLASERAFQEAVDQTTLKAEVKAKFQKSDLDAAMDNFLVHRDKYGGVKGDGDLLPDVNELSVAGNSSGSPSSGVSDSAAQRNPPRGGASAAANEKNSANGAVFIDDDSLFARVHRILRNFPFAN